MNADAKNIVHFHSRIFHPHIFDGARLSSPVFSVAPYVLVSFFVKFYVWIHALEYGRLVFSVH